MEPFRDQKLKGMHRPATGRIEITDARCSGLTFRVTDKNARTFSFRFRDPKSGRVQRYTIGDYPDLSLAKARRAADRLRTQVAEGINPVEARKRERQTAASRSFGAVAARYLEEYVSRHNRPSTYKQADRNLNRHLLPIWKNRHIDTIERADIIELTEKLIAAGKPVMANRVQALISTIYSFALDAGLSKFNPCARLRKRGTENRATRVLSDDEIRQLWARATLPPLSRSTGLALRLILLTGSRPGEIAGITRSELQHLDNAEKAVWNIPGERTKNGRAHAVPLSCMARETIKAALELIPPEQNFIFATRLKRGGSLRPHSLTVAMKRLTGKVKGPGAATWKKNVPTPHDLRRTLATRLSSLGTPAEDVSAVLNHIRRDVTGMHYDQYARFAEKRRALVAWAESLKGILGNGGENAL
jgi:integrase